MTATEWLQVEGTAEIATAKAEHDDCGHENDITLCWMASARHLTSSPTNGLPH